MRDGLVEKKLVLGIGSGRSGSLSLAVLLNRHPRAAISHELRPIVAGDTLGRRTLNPPAWSAPFQQVEPLVDQMLTRTGPVVGDVASYWLPHVEEVLARLPDTRVVCLRRARDETVDSFMRRSGDKNHWMEHDGSNWRHEPVWDPCFPKYQATSKREAIGMYWDDYYSRAEHLAERFPQQVRVWDMRQALDTKAGVNGLLAFVGLDDAPLLVGINRNRSERRIGTYARMLWVRVTQRR